MEDCRQGRHRCRDMGCECAFSAVCVQFAESLTLAGLDRRFGQRFCRSWRMGRFGLRRPPNGDRYIDANGVIDTMITVVQRLAKCMHLREKHRY